MELSRGILKNFAQITNDSSNNKTSTSVHATAVVVDGVKYAKIDGSNVLTPISETTDVQTGDRILVTIENHKAVVIGNFTYPPSARNEQKALEESERASSTANLAIEKAGQAQSLASEANTLSSQANTAANQAVASAQQASTLAQNAQSAASEANTKSDSALASASESLTKSNAAQKELDALKAEVKTVQGDVADARAEAIASVDAVKEELSVNYAKKTEVTAVEGSLKAEITKSVSELQSTISEQYTAKSDSVALEERLQSQITQNADNISSVVSRTTKLETDTSEAQKQIDAAKADAAKAQSTADAAQAAAKTAKDNADAAQSAADTAQANAATAQSTADAAKARAEAANTAAANAQSDLDAAKANLNEVTNRVGATEEEIAAAQQAVDDAQAAADQAIANAASANTAAANAQTAADKAKTDAANAQSAANTAQIKADSASAAAATAQAAADKAQADADALKSRVTTCETNISQNAEAIALRATKTELTDAVDGIQVGGRNCIENSEVFDHTKKPFENSNVTLITASSYPSLDGAACYSCSDAEYMRIDFPALSIGREYTFSIDIARAKGISTQPVFITIDGNVHSVGNAIAYNWTRFFVVFTATSTSTHAKIQVFNYSGFSKTNYYAHARHIKLEKGNKPTDWSPAPEDQDAATQAVADNLASNYYNKTQTDAQIKVKADSILSTVSSTYQTKDAMRNYSTTAQMKTAIEQSATSIKSEVSATYATNAKVDGIQVGGRNLYYTKTIGRGLGVAHCSSATVQNGEIILVASGSDLYIGSVLNSGAVWNEYYSPLMDIEGSSYVTFSVSNPLFTKNFYNFLDADKKALSGYATILKSSATLSVPSGAKYISMRFGYGSSVSGTTYKLKIKVEKGNKPTDWSPAPEDVDSSIGEVKTIAEQTANQFKWIVKSGTSESNMVLTDTLYSLVAENINLTGKVTFSCLDSAAQQKINTAQSTADSAYSWTNSNGSNMTSLLSMVKKWTNNAVSDTTTIQGGWIATNTITADKIAIGLGGNLYPNYDTFENITNGTITYDWTAGTATIDTSTSYYGTQCLKIVANNNDSYIYLGHSSNGYGCIPVQNGKIYRVSCYVKSSSSTSVEIYVVGHTGKNSTNSAHLVNTYGTIGTSWKRLECSYTASSSYPYISIRMDNNTNGTTIWVDAIQIEEVTSSSQKASPFKPSGATLIDGSNIITGTVTAEKISVTSLESICAKIGGFTIGSSAIYNNTTALAGAANSVYLGTDGISCGTTFKVTKAGAVTATSGTVGGFTLSSTELTNTANNSGIHFRYSGSTPAYNDIYIGGSNHNILVSAYDSLNKAKYEIIIGGDNPYAIEIKPSYLSADAGFVTDKSLFIDNYGIYKESGETIEFRNDLAFPNAGRVGTRDNPTGNHIIKNNRGIYFKTTDGSDYRGIGMSSADQLLIGMTSNASVSALLGCSIVPSSNDTFNLGSTSSVFNYVYTSTMRIGLNTYSEANAAINTKWKDGNTHNILTRGTDGLTSAIGWVGSASYATVLKLNSRTVQVVNSSGTSTLSDGRLKKDFRNLEAWERFYLDLEPIAYKYKDGSSGRNHMGFVAQQVEKALLNNGLTTNDFAGLVKYDVNPDDEDGWHGYKTEYGLIYTEFTALNTYMTQKNAKAVKELSHRFTVLDGKVNSTYARMASAEERINKLEKENKQLREEIAQLKMAS